MNPRCVHKLMLDHFVEPPLTLDWAIVRMVANNGVAGGWTLPENHATASPDDGATQGMHEAD